jgi:hypothetical protein
MVTSPYVKGAITMSDTSPGQPVPGPVPFREGQRRHRVIRPAVSPAGYTLSCNESAALRAVERQHFHATAVPLVLNTPLNDGRIAATHWLGLFVHQVHP